MTTARFLRHYITVAVATGAIVGAQQTSSAPDYTAYRINADTSQGVPLALRSAGTKPFFVPPHFSPQQHSRNEWLPADTSKRAAPLLGGGNKPIFVPPFFSSQIHHPQREWLGVPLQNRDNTFIGGGAKPTFEPQYPLAQKWPYLPLDTTQDMPNSLRQPPSPVIPPPFIGPQYRWNVVDTSQDSPAYLLTSPLPAVTDLQFSAPPYVWFVRDTSQQGIRQLPAPIGESLSFSSPQYVWNVTDTSQDSPNYLLTSPLPSATNQIANAPQIQGMVRDTSQRAILTPPTPVTPSLVITSPQYVWNVTDTSQSVPDFVIQPPVGEQQTGSAPQPAQFFGDTSQSAFAAVRSPIVFPPGEQVVPSGPIFEWQVVNTSQSSPTALIAPPPAPPPPFQAVAPSLPIWNWNVVDTSQSTPTPYIPPFVPPIPPTPGFSVPSWGGGSGGCEPRRKCKDVDEFFEKIERRMAAGFGLRESIDYAKGDELAPVTGKTILKRVKAVYRPKPAQLPVPRPHATVRVDEWDETEEEEAIIQIIMHHADL